MTLRYVICILIATIIDRTYFSKFYCSHDLFISIDLIQTLKLPNCLSLTLRQVQNGRNFSDIFKCISFVEWEHYTFISIKLIILLILKSALFHEMACHLFTAQPLLVSIGTKKHCNYANPRYIFPGGRSMKTSQIPMFLFLAARVWGQHWHT